MFTLLTRETVRDAIRSEPTGTGHSRSLWGHNWDTYWLAGDFSEFDFSNISIKHVSFHGIELRGADLRGARLERVELQDVSLCGADLRGAHFEAAFLNGCRMQNTDLRHASFTRSYLRDIDFTGSRVSAASLEASYLEGATSLAVDELRIENTFVHPNVDGAGRAARVGHRREQRQGGLSGQQLREADLRGIDLSEANLENVTFYGCDLRGAVLRAAKISQAAFNWCDLRGCDFTNASLQGTHFDSCDMRGANLGGAQANGARFLRACNASEANFSHANLAGASFSADFDHQTYANLNHADFRDSDLTTAKFEIVNMGAARFERATIGGLEIEASLPFASLAGLDLRNTNFKEIHSLFRADLSGVDLSERDLHEIGFVKAEPKEVLLEKANLRGADLSRMDLSSSRLCGADLRSANLSKTVLEHADLSGAMLRDAILASANLRGANMAGADLTGADLTEARLVGVNLEGASLVECSIYGISVWNSKINSKTKQSSLLITLPDEPAITVDNLEVAQFVYLLINNENIRSVVDTITKKVVLILGRFSASRKPVLDAIRTRLRSHDYLPIIFDFEKPASRDLTETISTLAHLARFIVADITDARSIPQELLRIVPNLPSVPVKPVVAQSDRAYAMFEHIGRFPWVLKVLEYQDVDHLLGAIEGEIIEPAEAMCQELAKR